MLWLKLVTSCTQSVWLKDMAISNSSFSDFDVKLCMTRCIEQQPSHRNSLLSRLAQHFPFMFNILKKPDSPLDCHHTKEINSLGNPGIPDVSNLQCSAEMLDMLSVDGTRPMDCEAEDASLYDEQLQEIFNTGEETLLSEYYSFNLMYSLLGFNGIFL